jgi:hypothetical protein
MKKVISSLLITVALFATLKQAEASQPQAMFTIAIDGPTQVAPGTPVKIVVRLKNTSDRELSVDTFYVEGLDTFFIYDVRDQAGKPVPKRKRAEAGGLRTRTLKAGETLEEGILISREFQMNQPGQYSIQLFRSVPEDASNQAIASNKLVVTVTP